MHLVIIVLIVLILVGAFGGSHLGFYPATYGLGGGVGLVLLILLILLVAGRL